MRGLCGRVGHHAALAQSCEDLANRRVGGLVVQLPLDERGQGLKCTRRGIFAAEEAVGDFLSPLVRAESELAGTLLLPSEYRSKDGPKPRCQPHPLPARHRDKPSARPEARKEATADSSLSSGVALARGDSGESTFDPVPHCCARGYSRARVTQVMNLLRLPVEIQAGLLRPPAPLEIHSFSERSLRVLVSCGDEETQTSRWRELVQELKGSADI